MASSRLNNVLIATHSFPPAGGIGGRRWAKFAKYLKRDGRGVEVLSANVEGGGSPWTADVAGIPHHTYAHRFPKILTQQPVNLLEKLRYRSALMINNRASEGSPYDRALYDESAFSSALSQMLQAGTFDTLVVSAAPFRLPLYALKLRTSFPNIRFVVDFRDPWTSGESYGYQSISPQRKAFEARAEAGVIAGFDLITTPWPALVENLRQKYPAGASRIQCLPHCYDPDDMAPRIENSSRNGLPRIAYGGNLYQGMDSIYQSLAQSASRGEVQVDMWASTTLPGAQSWRSNNFRMHNTISSKAFFAEAANADALLFPIPEVLRNGYPTKLLEYAATGLPLLAVGHPGSVSQLLSEKGLGTFHSFEAGMPNWRQMLTSASEAKADRAWIHSHEATAATRCLIELIENTAHEH